MEILLLTGMSGAGKTQAGHTLEDLGYYCIDNMPSAMIPYFVDICSEMPMKSSSVAFIMDVRGESDFASFLNGFELLKEKGHQCHTIYLECDDQVLINRYKETRRAHPLVNLMNLSVSDAIATERRMLAPVRDVADYFIDTSTLTTAQLKDKLMLILNCSRTDSLVITCMSFGYKYGIPAEADLVFDVRCFRNPFYVPDLKPLTGLDPAVRDYVMTNEATLGFMDRLYALIDYLVPLYVEEGKTQVTIAIGCTGGKHRSVAVAEALSSHFKDRKLNSITLHRDMVKKFVGDK